MANEQNPWHLAAVKFGEELSSLTDGRIAVEGFPNESLGKEIDLINGTPPRNAPLPQGVGRTFFPGR